MSKRGTTELTATRLRELLAYSPKTGLFVRNCDASNAKAGDVAGAFDRKGYINIRVDGPIYKAHRLAFLYVTGEWPKSEVDHRNGDKADNRWANLRDASAAINAQNHKAPRVDSRTGMRGVCWRKKEQKFVAQIQVGGRRKCLGYFEFAEDASRAYEAARLKHHPGFCADEVCA